ncbi:MAG: hypothetical protein ACERKN_07060 [Velocimicrobium sp.]
MIDLGSLEIVSSELTDEDVENLMLLYTTPQGTIPLNRGGGIDFSIIGLPIEEAKSLFLVNIINKTNEYNASLEVDTVEFDIDTEEGKIKPKVVISRGE